MVNIGQVWSLQLRASLVVLITFGCIFGPIMVDFAQNFHSGRKLNLKNVTLDESSPSAKISTTHVYLFNLNYLFTQLRDDIVLLCC